MSKILYTASTISHINNFHTEYIEALRKGGHTVLVMAGGEGADFNIPFEKKIFSRKNTECRRKIRQILIREKFDAVILNTTLAAFHIRLACPKKNRPKIVNIVHGYLFSENTSILKRKVFLLCEKILKKKTDSLILMNSDDMKIAEKHRLSLKNTYMSLGMGAKRKPVNDENVEKIASSAAGNYNMVFVGELSARKNQAFLIRALKKISESVPNARLWLVGEGDERESLEALADALGVAEKVEFVGSVPNPCDFISAFDLYVSASVIEGLPFNILEALSCKKTVLASNIKGHNDIISDGISGFLYPFGDEDSFVSRVLDIYRGNIALDEGEIYAAYERFSFENVFENTLSLMKASIEI